MLILLFLDFLILGIICWFVFTVDKDLILFPYPSFLLHLTKLVISQILDIAVFSIYIIMPLQILFTARLSSVIWLHSFSCSYFCFCLLSFSVYLFLLLPSCFHSRLVQFLTWPNLLNDVLIPYFFLGDFPSRHFPLSCSLD